MASQIASMEVFGLLICLFSLRQILLPSIHFVPKCSHFFASRKDTERMQLFNDGEEKNCFKVSQGTIDILLVG